MNYKGIIIVAKDILISKNIVEYLISKFIGSYQVYVSKINLQLNMDGYIDYVPNENLICYPYKDDILISNNVIRYIINNQEISKIRDRGNIPVLVLPAVLAEQYLKNDIQGEYMSFWIDDIKGEKRLDERSFDRFTYRITNNHVDDTCKLIDKLWTYRNTGGALSRDMITKMMKCDMLIVGGNINNISNASYDLTLGDEYYYGGEIRSLDNSHSFIPLEPYDYVIASCKEMMAFPRDVIGRFDLVVNLFFEGIILSNSTQVDPGFNGKLFCLLFNTSNKTVYLKRGMAFSTLEFNKLFEPSTPYSGKHAYEESMETYLPRNIMHGAINELKKEVENLRKDYREMQTIYLGSLAVIIAVLSVLITKN